MLIIAYVLASSDREKTVFSETMAGSYRRFPRRQLGADLRIRDLERLLSLPAWRTRHETYGVWVATEIVKALDDHEVTINHRNGELRFAFAESRIAEVESARPKVSLISERRTPLVYPVGKGRDSSVQPDYGLWAEGRQPDKCVMVVEAKHYKRRSRRNFRDALIDYATAHLQARVVLVNYGPVGKPFDDLPSTVEGRCRMIGYFNPQNRLAREAFLSEVRGQVGEPLVEVPAEEITDSVEAVAIDVSSSMRSIMNCGWFSSFLSDLDVASSRILLVDCRIRAIVNAGSFSEWVSTNELRPFTALHGPVSEILRKYERVVVVTDHEGLDSLMRLDAKIAISRIGADQQVTLVQVSRPRRALIA